MATLSQVLSLCLITASPVAARVPEKADLRRYEHLWTNSPICSPEKIGKQAAAPGFIAEWLLAGVSEIEGGYRVTLAHRHRAGEFLVIRPERAERCSPDRMEALPLSAFRIERIAAALDWRDFEVHLVAGADRGVLKFEEKALQPSVAPQPAVSARTSARPLPIPSPRIRR